MNSSSLSTKTWPLLRYAVEVNTHSTSSPERQQFVSLLISLIFIWSFLYRPQRQVIDCSEGLLRLTFTPTQQLLVIRDETDTLECVDFLSMDSSSLLATYTGDSLLISYLIPNDHTQRKFLVKFASTTTENGCQQCKDAITFLSRFLTITHFDSPSNPLESTNSIVSLPDMIQSLMKDNSLKLSNYYNQDLSFNGNENTHLLEKHLSDETFPDFVANVAAILHSFKDV